ncbi:MAG: hypothetical protein ABSH16_00435 [Sedimentisphaerales bacterium]
MKKISVICKISLAKARLRQGLRVVAATICGFIFLIGCESVDPAKIAAPAINTTDGMISYLKSQNLPALKSIEPWENQYGPGLKLTTAHYEIYTTLLEPLMLSQVPGFVESAYRGYQSQLPEPIETTTLFTVYLFADRKQWETFTTGFTGRLSPVYLKIKAGAYYLNGACVAYNIGRERTFATLGHEGWHQFNSRYFKYRLPSWLDEGIAMQFEMSTYDTGMFRFEPARNGYRLGSLKQTLMKNQMIPLRDLIGMNPGEAIIESDDATAAFYSQSYALVRFLREDDYGKRLLKYQKMLLDGLTGAWPLDETDKRIAEDRNIPITVSWNRMAGTLLFANYIGDETDKIEKQYVTFCRKIVYYVQLK